MVSKNHILRLFICFTLFIGLLTPFSPSASAQSSVDAAKTLSFDKPVSGELGEGETIWYKIYPDKTVETKSHVEFTVEGDSSPIISVFPDLQSAKNGVTYEKYAGQSGSVKFPIAWKGPYYISLTGEYSGSFQLAAGTLTEEPTEHPGGVCFVEESTKSKSGAFEILSDMRTIRDQLLSDTALGKELVSLYYNVSKQTILEVVKDKEFRKTISEDLASLSDLIKEMEKAAVGESSRYVVSKDDYRTITHLKKAVLDKTSPSLDRSINAYWDKLNLDQLEGKQLTAALQESELIIKTKNYKENELIVSFKEETSSKRVLKTAAAFLGTSVKVKELKANDVVLDQTYLVSYKNEKSPQELAEELEKLPEVKFAEPNYIVHALTKDIHYPYHWSLENTGQNEGAPGADIDFLGLEKLLKGMKLTNTLISVVDTGTNYTLQDLQSVTRKDLGKDFVNQDGDAMDDNDHGTHVAGTIAAVNNNFYSMTGINQFSRILPVKALDESGSGDMADVALGIRHAVDKGAKVINLSLGSTSYSDAVEQELIYAKKKGVTVVAASGNDGEEAISYPGSSEYVIGVGATDNQDILADFSNYGEELDIVAPGVGIPSLTHNGEVMYASGTSMATPHVAAVAGLIYSINPNVTPDEVKKLLTLNSVDLGTKGFDPEYGWGRLDAAKAVKAAKDSLSMPQKPVVNQVDDNDQAVSGKSAAGATITVMKEKTVIGTAAVKTNGDYSVSIKQQKAGTVLQVTAANKYGKSASAAVTVLDKTAPGIPAVNEVSDKSKEVSGTAEAGSTATVKIGTKSYTAKADAKGNFKVAIPVQKKGTKLTVTATDAAKNVSGAKTVTVVDKTPPAVPAVNTVTDKSKEVTGTAEADSTVTVKIGTKNYTAKANAKGSYKVGIPVQKKGTKLTVTATDAAKNISGAKTVTVVDKTPPAVPVVNTVTDKSKEVTGTAEADSTVTVKIGTKNYTAKANAKGSYKVGIPVQKKGTKLAVTATDAAKNVSGVKTVTVVDKTPPAVPAVNTVTDKSKEVTGTAEADSTVTVKIGSKKYTAKANAKGSYKVGIPVQKKGTKLTVTATDAAGNASGARYVTVTGKK
ncbi:Ig-like domain-containing protein [Metabacillus sp. JX24]|uniref:S8 family peptidase n=1 Tax=Metabacillus sp. JX24 TaxID=3240759 RepID=UPI00350F5648